MTHIAEGLVFKLKIISTRQELDRGNQYRYYEESNNCTVWNIIAHRPG